MHLIYLEVVKKLMLNLWCSGKPPYKLPAVKVNLISQLLLEQSKNIPKEFCRKPRSLSELKRWKATEFRQFLFYTGPVVLKSVLENKYYKNFLALFIASSILISPSLCSDQNLEYAHSLLIYFVKSFSLLYGKEFESHNVHNLLHIVNDVKKFGSMDSFSAFPFENYLQSIKKLIRKSEKPAQQIANRLNEKDSIMFKKKIIKHVPKEHYSGPLLPNTYSPQYSSSQILL